VEAQRLSLEGYGILGCNEELIERQ
jgi:hypothetical protein